MKLYLTVNRPIPNTYIGIDLAQQKIDFGNLDPICERAECTEMVLDGMLSYVLITKIPDLLLQLVTRLRKEGQLIIKDIEINEAIKMYINGQLNIYDLNTVLFGDERLNKRAAYSHFDIQQILTQLGLQITSIELSNITYTLTAQRT